MMSADSRLCGQLKQETAFSKKQSNAAPLLRNNVAEWNQIIRMKKIGKSKS